MTNQTNATPKTGSLFGLAYAALCYLATLAGLSIFVLFVSGIDLIDAIHINRGANLSLALALVVNLGLIAFWGIQHSAMARKKFKDAWTKIIPAHTERATYCLASAVALAIVCFLWVPIGGSLWHLDGAAAIAMRTISAIGWLILLVASFEIDHFDLFGLKQPLRALRGTEAAPSDFKQRFLYRLVRHPIQLGVLVGTWFTPHMTVGHLLFAALMTVYIHVGLHFEERALLREFGRRYETYKELVPKVLPFPRPRSAGARYNLSNPRRRITMMMQAPIQ